MLCAFGIKIKKNTTYSVVLVDFTWKFDYYTVMEPKGSWTFSRLLTYVIIKGKGGSIL